MLLAVLVLALMGLARMPVPCVGDGAGQHCTVNACACTDACSCRLSCQAMASDPHFLCRMDQGEKAPAHFSLPEPPPAVLGVRIVWPAPVAAAPDLPAAASSREPPVLTLPEPPPRALS